MKKAILLPCFLLGGLSLMAQSQHLPVHQRSAKAEKNSKFISGLLAKQVATAGTANKPTTVQQRVIAQAFIDNNGDREDSSKYKYSGFHTSKYNFNGFNLQYNTAFQSDYLPTALSSLTDPSSNLLADSIFNYQQDTVRETWKAFYRTDNKLDSFSARFNYNAGNVTEKTKQTYNTSGNLTQAQMLDNYASPNVFAISGISKYFYDTNGTLASDTSYSEDNGAFVPENVNVYHFTANLLDTVRSYDLTSASAYPTLTVLKYTANNYLQNLNGYSYNDTGGLIYIETDTFGYTGSSPYYSLYNSVSVDIENNDVDGQTTNKIFGTNNLPDSVNTIYFDQNGMYENIALKYTYNSYNNPTTLVLTDMMDTSYAGQYNFYYETFDDAPPPPPTAINNIKDNKDFNIYPNPFDNKINITWKGANANNAKIALVNVLGQTVFTTERNLMNGNNTLDMPNMVKGSYILLIQDAKGNTWKNRMVKN